MVTESEAYERLGQYLAGQGRNPQVGGEGWRSAALKNLWVLTPPGRGGGVFVIAPGEVRWVQPTHENLGDVVQQMVAK
jgi:hypothetical protein